ncbi:hypothetical protein EV359DRAFT_87268 [Lentinula novae-zelandiae]|nr:hypothetical protein EV359DRAFT_87268 [Lentinula novae-zelandiae]
MIVAPYFDLPQFTNHDYWVSSNFILSHFFRVKLGCEIARRRRADGSGDQPCRCHECSKQDPEGVLAPQSVLIAHRHRDRLRAAFASATQTAETEAAPESFTTSRGRTESNLENQPSESSRPASNSFGKTLSCNNTETVADFKAWLCSVVTEIDLQIEALYDCNLGLEFITPPSQMITFVFPDPESLLLANSGLFALNPGRVSNRHLLDAEARFCHLLRTIQALPPGEHSMGVIDVEDELFQALNKVHQIKERHWQAKAYCNRDGGLNVDNRRHFTRKQMTKEAPTLIAALIIYVKFQTPVCKMRVILALFHCIIKGLMRRQKIDSQVASRIPEDIHTIVDHYDLDPTLHISIVCPNCYVLFPFTNEAISNSENALRANQPLPVCNERSHPDLSPCSATLWHTRRIGLRTFVTPIRKQAFQDLQEWIGRILAIPGLEDIIDQHQRHPLPSLESPERDFVDSSTFHI